MAWWLIMAVLLLVAVGFIAPQQLPVILVKLCLVAVGAVAGYWMDRELFPYARPDDFLTLPKYAAREGRKLVAVQKGSAESRRQALASKVLGGFPEIKATLRKEIEAGGRTITFEPEPGIVLTAQITAARTLAASQVNPAFRVDVA